VREKHYYLAGGWRLVPEQYEREILEGWRPEKVVAILARSSFTAFGRLELEWYERKTLLPGWWLEASAGAM